MDLGEDKEKQNNPEHTNRVNFKKRQSNAFI